MQSGPTEQGSSLLSSFWHFLDQICQILVAVLVWSIDQLLFVLWFKDSHVRNFKTHMTLVYSIIHARLETIFTTMSCFTFVPTCKNGWHIVQLLGKKMAIAENAKQTTLKWLAMACTLSKVEIFQIAKSFQWILMPRPFRCSNSFGIKNFWSRVKKQI